MTDDMWHCIHHRELDEARRELAECRAQLELFRDAGEAAELRIVELRAVVSRVEALGPKLKERSRALRDEHYEYCASSEVDDAADDIVDALRGDL